VARAFTGRERCEWSFIAKMKVGLECSCLLPMNQMGNGNLYYAWYSGNEVACWWNGWELGALGMTFQCGVCESR